MHVIFYTSTKHLFGTLSNFSNEIGSHFARLVIKGAAGRLVFKVTRVLIGRITKGVCPLVARLSHAC